MLSQLGLERCGSNYISIFFNLFLWMDILGTFCIIGFRWMPQIPIDDKSTLVQVMAWCHQATSHYLNLCWLRYVSSYGVTRPQWLNSGNIMKSCKISLAISGKWWETYYKYIKEYCVIKRLWYIKLQYKDNFLLWSLSCPEMTNNLYPITRGLRWSEQNR